MVSRKAVLAGVGIAVAGAVGYLMYKAYAQQQQAPPVVPPPTPPPTQYPEVLQTDRTTYRVAEVINWTASNLITGQQYSVGFVKNGYLIDYQTFVASSSSQSGQTLVTGQITPTLVTGQITPGTWEFALIRVSNPSDPSRGTIVSSVTLSILPPERLPPRIYPI